MQTLAGIRQALIRLVRQHAKARYHGALETFRYDRAAAEFFLAPVNRVCALRQDRSDIAAVYHHAADLGS